MKIKVKINNSSTIGHILAVSFIDDKKKEHFPQKNIDFLLHKVQSNALLCSHDNDKIKKKRCGKKEKKKKDVLLLHY